MKKRFLLLASLLCSYMTLYSQFTISGIVNDENGKALEGANVTLEENPKTTLTDQNGAFVLNNLHSGDYHVKISFLGYEDAIEVVTPEKMAHITINLKVKAFLTDEVIVSATRASDNDPVTKSDVLRNEIRSQNTGQDVPYMLALTPSVVTSSDAGTGVGYTAMRIRGTDMTGINVTVNGIPFNDAESHGVYWVDMPDIASSAENIQIQRGVGASTHGAGAFGGTVNFQTTSLKTKSYVELNNAYGSFYTLKNAVSFGTGLLNEHFTLDGRLSRITSDGYIDRAWSNLKSYYLAASWYNKTSLLKFITFSGLEHTYQAWDGVPSDLLNTHRTYNDLGEMYTDSSGQIHYYKNQTDNYQQDNYQLLFSHSFSSALSFNAALHFTKGKGYFEEYEPTESLAAYGLDTIFTPKNDTIAKSNIIRRKWLDNVFYGATWSLNYTTYKVTAILGGGLNQYFGKHYGTVIWAQYMSNGEIDHQYYYNTGTKNDVNVFGKITCRISDEISGYADLQYRHIEHDLRGIDDDNIADITQNHHYNFYNPKVGLTWTINKYQSIYGYFGIAHREPTRDDFVDAEVSKPTPHDEALKDLELGYNYKADNLRLGINGYYMNYTDQLVLTGKLNDVGASIFTNAPKSYRMGIEGTMQFMLGNKLSWDVNATLSKNTIKNFISHTDSLVDLGDRQIAFSPSLIFGNKIQYHLIKQMYISLTTKYVGKQYFDNTEDNSRKLNAYFLNDIQVNYNIKVNNLGNIEFILKMNNIFDEKYSSNAAVYPYYDDQGKYTIAKSYFPQAGRNMMVGLNISF